MRLRQLQASLVVKQQHPRWHYPTLASREERWQEHLVAEPGHFCHLYQQEHLGQQVRSVRQCLSHRKHHLRAVQQIHLPLAEADLIPRARVWVLGW